MSSITVPRLKLSMFSVVFLVMDRHTVRDHHLGHHLGILARDHVPIQLLAVSPYTITSHAVPDTTR